MKKIISLVLILLLLVSVLPTIAFAEGEEKSETFICDGTTLKVKGEYFNLSSVYISKGGWNGGTNKKPLTITARNGGVYITHIDAHICNYANLYDGVGVSRGTKVPESLGNVQTGDISVIDINYKEFAFTNGEVFAPFDEIIVYFKTCEDGGHCYDSDNVCVGCGKTKCEVEGHNYEQVAVYKCLNCGEEAIESYVPESGVGGVGSTFFEGDLTFIVGVSCFSVGFLVAMLIFKKKPALVNNDEE